MRTTTSSLALAALLLPALSGATTTNPEHGPSGGKGKGKGKPCNNNPKPYVTSEKLQALVNIDDLLAGANKLQAIATANGGTRVFGSGGHNSTVDWIMETLEATNYYNIFKQPFTEVYSAGNATLNVVSDNGRKIESNIMTYTPGGFADNAPLVAIANLGCNPADYPASVSGKIALISRGECTFAQKSTNAKTAGALGAIVYNNADGAVAGTLGDAFGEYAPIIGISQVEGQALLASLQKGEEVKVKFDVKSVTENRITYNVIAETKMGDHNNVLVLGGHTDSVAAGPGINDDGSGTVGVLNVAVALSKFKVKNAVRFGFWSAEEFGLLGSEFYMKSVNSSETEVAKMRAYLNFDMIASPNYILGVYDGDGNAFNLTGPAGSDTIEKDFEEFFASQGLPSVPTEFSGRSDYAAFIENGIPSGGLFTGAEVPKTEAQVALFGGVAGVAYDKNYHEAGDTVDNLALDAFLVNTKAIAHSVAKYAMSWTGMPAVNLLKRRTTGDRIRFAKRSGAHKHSHSGPCGAKDNM